MTVASNFETVVGVVDPGEVVLLSEESVTLAADRGAVAGVAGAGGGAATLSEESTMVAADRGAVAEVAGLESATSPSRGLGICPERLAFGSSCNARGARAERAELAALDGDGAGGGGVGGGVGTRGTHCDELPPGTFMLGDLGMAAAAGVGLCPFGFSSSRSALDISRDRMTVRGSMQNPSVLHCPWKSSTSSQR